MRSAFTANHSRTLVVDPSAAQGGQLTDQLNHAGFKTEFAVSWHGARASLRANHYQSCIVIAEPDQVEDVKIDETPMCSPEHSFSSFGMSQPNQWTSFARGRACCREILLRYLKLIT
jgi:hypothetical protein